MQSIMHSDLSPMGSSVLSNEEIALMDVEDEKLIKELRNAVESSVEAKKFLNTRLGKDLIQYIIQSKSRSLIGLADRGNTEDQRAEYQLDYDVINGVAQFFGNIIQGGQAAEQQLTAKESNDA